MSFRIGDHVTISQNHLYGQNGKTGVIKHAHGPYWAVEHDDPPPQGYHCEEGLYTDEELTRISEVEAKTLPSEGQPLPKPPPLPREVRPTQVSGVQPANGEVRIVDPKTGGEKGRKDERWDLLPFDAMDEIARVYAFGAKKYADDNWLKGYAWRLSLGALLRHISRFACGEDRDPETGCLHLAHAGWHCLTLITFHMRKLGTDDRAKREAA